MVGLNSTEAFLTLDKEILIITHKNLRVVGDKAIASASCVYCGVITIQYLDCMALAISLLVNRGINPDAELLVTLYRNSVVNFKKGMQHMISTKAITDGVDLTKIPNNRQQNTTAFKNYCTTIEEELYQNTSADEISPIGYVI